MEDRLSENESFINFLLRYDVFSILHLLRIKNQMFVQTYVINLHMHVVDNKVLIICRY